MNSVITRGIREFVERDWRAVREAKDRYWGDRISVLGAREGFRIAEELRSQAVARDSSWPDAFRLDCFVKPTRRSASL